MSETRTRIVVQCKRPNDTHWCDIGNLITDLTIQQARWFVEGGYHDYDLRIIQRTIIDEVVT